MNKNILNIGILVIGILISGFIANSAFAEAEITYPIASLGNCGSKGECKTYCDKAENVDACLSFAETNNMMSTEEVDTAKNFKKGGFVGPGQCKGKEACYTYCSSTEHMDECVSFAEKKGLMKGDNLEKIKGQAKKVKEAIAKGIKPPACSSPKECSSYCKETAHMEECINFAKEAGMMDEQEQGKAEKVLAAIKDGATPPSCTGKEECDSYCRETTHMEECLNFAMKAGLMTGEEKGQAQKTINAIRNGIKAPNCKGKEECKVYCEEESNLEECMTFAEATGKIKKEDKEKIRSTGGKGFGPGGEGKGGSEGKGGPNGPDGQGPEGKQGGPEGDRGGQGNNGGNKGQSGWSNGTGNGGPDSINKGGQNGGKGGPGGQGGPGMGGPGGGQGKGTGGQGGQGGGPGGQQGGGNGGGGQGGGGQGAPN